MGQRASWVVLRFNRIAIRIFRTPIRIHWTFLLVPPAILWFSREGNGVDWERAVWYGAVALSIFSYILAHEIGHAAAARLTGTRAEWILIFPLGGGAYIPQPPERTRAEVFVYAAGPLANFLLAGLAAAVLAGMPDGDLLLLHALDPGGNLVVNPTQLERLLGLGLGLNLLLGLSNLLPAYPLDGGRILLALLKQVTRARVATVVTAVVGIGIAAGLVVVAYHFGDWLLLAGGLFIVSQCVLSVRHGWQRRRLAATPVTDLLRSLPTPDDRLYPTDSVADATARMHRHGWPGWPVYDVWNQPLGFVDADIFTHQAATDDARLATYVDAYAVARLDWSLLDVLDRMMAEEADYAFVYGPRGVVRGYVFADDMNGIIQPWWRRGATV